MIAALLLSLSGCEGATAVPAVEAEIALQQFTVATPGLEFPARTAVQLKAWGVYADGRKVDLTAQAQWINHDGSVARVGPTGIVQLDSPGVARFEVKYRAFTVPVELKVNAAQLTALSLSSEQDGPLAKGDTRRFSVRAWYDDGSSLDVTDRASWATDRVAFDLGAAPGTIVGRAEGAGVVRVSYFSQEASALVRVDAARFVGLELSSPRLVIKPGDSQQLSLFATYSDGTRHDVSAESSWTSSDENVLEVIRDGVVRGLLFARNAGQAQITAHWQGAALERVVVVSPREVVGVRFATPSVQLAEGRVTGVDLLAELDDGSTAVVTEGATFSSTQPAVAEVSNEAGARGRVESKAMGVTFIEARYADLVARYEVLVTAPELVSLTPSMSGGRLAVGQVAELVVSGAFTDGSSLNLTSSVMMAHGPVVSSQVAYGRLRITGVTLGPALLDVQLGALSAQVAYEVTDVALTAVEILDASRREEWSAGLLVPQHRLRAIGVYADGARLDVSELAAWRVDDAHVVGLIDEPGSRGAYALARGGTTNVTVSMAGADYSTPWAFAPNP